MATVELKGIRKSFAGGHVAVRDVTLTIGDGEFVVLVGPSGCGKSTLLRIVAGLERATRGEVWIGSRRVDDLQPKDRDVAMVFQSYALYPHMTAYDNIAFGLRARRIARDEIQRRVDEAARMLGIGNLLARRPRELSGGERQRVALGRAIVRDPQAFLFDEPLSNLDARLRTQMRAEISALHRRLGVTTLYVTHDQVEALTMGERIVVLREGCVQQVGAPLEVYRRPANLFVAGFIGSPPMNFLPVRVETAGGASGGPSLCFGDLELKGGELPRLRGGLEGRRIMLGIRPEDLRPVEEGGIPAKVTLVEPTGGDLFVYAQVQGTTLIARAPGAATFEPGGGIRLQADLTRAHLFDPDTTERLELGG
jgi:ABC-type sugar transport system ATPase subunit